MSADPIIYCLETLTDYRQFERLCSDVMNQSGYRDIEPLGGSNDRGRDAIHVSRFDPENVTIFAYSVRDDWQSKLLNEDCVRIREEGHELKHLVFACTSNATSTQRDSVIEKVLSNFGWTLELFDLERLRVRLSGDLRFLIAQHPSIFCPPFFPTRGGLSITNSQDTLVIDHQKSDHALATWLALRLQIEGHRVWCSGNAPMAGENADESIRTLIANRASRYIPILSAQSTANSDFIARCSIALHIDGIVLPCVAGEFESSLLPSKLRYLGKCIFSESWSDGLRSILNSLAGSGIKPALGRSQGAGIALRSYVPEPVTKQIPETVYSNTFPATVPAAIQVINLARELGNDEKSELWKRWAFVEADSKTLLSFENPPTSIPLVESQRIPAFSWKHYEFKFNKRSTSVVKELIRRSLDLACIGAGLRWCDDRRRFYFFDEQKTNLNLSYVHVDGRKTHVGATGVKKYGSGEKGVPFRYQLCPIFAAGQDEAGSWWVTMRIYVRVTEMSGKPYVKKAITRRRKRVAKNWWNKEWFSRTIAVMQALASGKQEISIGTGLVTVSTKPLQWECPIAIDYFAVERLGDFQEEIAAVRYMEEDELDDEIEGMVIE